MTREKARDQDRFEWQRRARLAEAGVASTHDPHTQELPTAPSIQYVRDEIVTELQAIDRVQEELHSNGVEFGEGRQDENAPGDEATPIVFKLFTEIDPVALVNLVSENRRERGEPDLPLAPHHVLSVARTKIGPGSDPWPLEPDDERHPRGPEVAGDAPVIGIVDTGVWHPMPQSVRLAAAAAEGDPVDMKPQNDVVDYPGGGHGLFIAGVIGHTAPGLGIVAHRGYEEDSQDILTEETVVQAGDRAIASGATILNLSLGTYDGNVVYLRRAVQRWVERGCLVVAAAGNDTLTDRWYPAGFAAERALAHGVVSVGALESRAGDGPGIHSAAAPFSNFGSWVTAWAPGADVISEYPEGKQFPYEPTDLSDPFDQGLAHWDGTSFAAPFVAAEIARYAHSNGLGNDVQKAWEEIRGDSPFVVFWPTWRPDDDRRGRYSAPTRRPRGPLPRSGSGKRDGAGRGR